jgi:hypothetical protein
MSSIQQVYQEAASVEGQTGVDPAIIAIIASTESDLSKSPISLGIGTAASRGGIGSSGQTMASGNNYGGTQPSGFFMYNNGAEAAQAFANYIRAYQPALVPDLSSAAAFFNPNGPILQSNYFVPTAGEIANAGSALAATVNYYATWLARARAFFPGDPGVASSSVTTSPGGTTDTDPGGNAIVSTPSTALSSGSSASTGASTTVGASGASSGVKLGSIGPQTIAIPDGLVLGLFAMGLLALGALLFVGGNRLKVNVGTVGGTVSAPNVRGRIV